MQRSKWLLVVVFALSILGVAVSGVSAKEYTVEWFNNMNYSDTIYHNSAGYCTDLTIKLIGMHGVQHGVYATKKYTDKLNVQNSYTMKISTPKLSGECESMILTGSCTYNKFGKTVTETTKAELSTCSNGRAVFLINAFSLGFYAK